MIKTFDDLKGQTISKIDRTDDTLTFTLENGQRCRFYHEQDCCESVSIESVVGTIDDLIGSPLLEASVIESNENPAGVDPPECQDSFTWTTYTFATERGTVIVRWYGESNGYYSEDVYFAVLRD